MQIKRKQGESTSQHSLQLKSINYAVNSLQSYIYISDLEALLYKWKIKINADKCTAVFFTIRKQVPRNSSNKKFGGRQKQSVWAYTLKEAWPGKHTLKQSVWAHTLKEAWPGKHTLKQSIWAYAWKEAWSGKHTLNLWKIKQCNTLHNL
jgi:hypothetical protein